MQKKLQDAVEAARDLPLEERVAVARELLMPRDEELSDGEMVELRSRLKQKHLYEPYRVGRRHSPAGAKGTRRDRAAR